MTDVEADIEISYFYMPSRRPMVQVYADCKAVRDVQAEAVRSRTYCNT